MAETSSDRAILDGLWIRHWALMLLADRVPPAAVTDRVRHADPEAWMTTMLTERCALPLHGVTAFAPLYATLPVDVREVLERCRLLELKRAMSVHAQLLQLSAGAAAGGWRAVVLKGGVAIAGGARLDSLDLDILVARSDLADVVAFLESIGATGRGEERIDAPRLPGFHLRPRRAPRALQVEVHHAVNGLQPAGILLAASVPLATLPALWRLPATEHLYHLIYHAVHQHPGRAGSLRDVLLTELALREATPDELAMVRSRLDLLRLPRESLAFLDFVAALRTADPLPDPFVAMAAARYLAYRRQRLDTRVRLFPASVDHIVLGGHQYRHWVAGLMKANEDSARLGWVNRLLARSPWAMRTGRRVYRATLLAAVLPGAYVEARRAAGLARRFVSEAGGAPPEGSS